jgi:hypothetical protein
MKWIGQHIYDLVARFRNDVYLEDLSTTTETNVLVVDSTGKVSKNTTTVGDITGITEGDNITVTDPNGPTPTVALSTNVDVAGTLDVTDLGTFDASITVTGKISLNDGGDSVFVGEDAGLNDDASANLNVGVGYQALRANTTGANNSAHGYRALYYNTTGINNSAVGFQALFSNTTGFYNSAHGFGALLKNTTGANNSAVGFQALYLNTTGNDNTSVGIYSSERNTTGTGNAALGYAALRQNATGNYNIAVGSNAGTYITGGINLNTVTDNSVFLGQNTKALADSQTNQIVIGYDATGLGSNTAILGNSSITKTQLQGNVGIGTTSPKNKLDIVGSLGRGAPVIKTATFTVGATENWLIMNGAATITITLPTASDWTGRELMIKNINDYPVVSASSNVKPIDTGTAGSTIFGGIPGSWCTLVSDGTNWVTMMSS